MNQETPPDETMISALATNVSAFFHLPNRRIFTLFLISSAATFFLGVSLLIEWFLHGQHNLGYFWLAYYAPTVTAFPVFVWLACIISSNFMCIKDQHTRALPLCTEVDQKVQHQEVQSLQEDDHQLALVAVVPYQDNNDHHHLDSTKQPVTCTSLVPVAPAKDAMDDAAVNLKRTFSLKPAGSCVDHSDIKRSLSYRL